MTTKRKNKRPVEEKYKRICTVMLFKNFAPYITNQGRCVDQLLKLLSHEYKGDIERFLTDGRRIMLSMNVKKSKFPKATRVVLEESLETFIRIALGPYLAEERDTTQPYVR